MRKSDRKIFATLFLSIFTAVTGVGIVVPLLPAYAHGMGAKGLYIGLVFGAFSVSRTFFLPYFGRCSDRKGRKPYIVAGLFAYAMISVAFVFAKTVEWLIAIRFVQGIMSAMIMPVVYAYVGDMTSHKREGITMGIFNMSVFLGLSIGPLAGGVIKDHFGLDFSFLCMGALSFLSFLLSLFMLPPTRTERVTHQGSGPTRWKVLLADRDIIGLFAFRFAYTACIGIIWSFLPLLADMEFSLSSGSIGILVMLGIFISGLMQTPMGFLADRMNRKLMVVGGGLVTGYAMISFEWAMGFWGLFSANVLFGIGGGICMAPHTAMTVRKGHRRGAMGSVMGLMTMAHSMGMTAGSLFAGLMMDMSQLRHAFSLGSLIMLVGVMVFFVCCTGTESASAHEKQNPVEAELRQVRQEIRPLDFSSEPAHPPAVIAYFKYYGLHSESVRHHFGSFDSGGYTLAAHVFQPRNPKGTVFLLHGYFDHTGMLKNLIRDGLDRNLAVAVYDLPGHGLSSGARTSVNDFSEYVAVLEDFIRLCQDLPRPWHLISHSTGSAITLEYLFIAREHQVFDKIIFLAPLVRFAHWKLARLAYHLTKPFVKTVPRKIRATSSDPDFVEFLKNDPLQARQLPIRWLNALYAWEKGISDNAPVSAPVLILQGTQDTVVDWKYNLSFLKKKINSPEIRRIENARHQLLNESEQIRSEVFRQIGSYLDDKPL